MLQTTSQGIRVTGLKRGIDGWCRGSSTVGRSATLTVEAVKTQQFTSFEDMVRASDVPVLVDFHATWCGPCKLMGDALRVSCLPAIQLA